MRCFIFSICILIMIGGFIGSIVLILKSSKPLSKKDVDLFEKKHNRLFTDEDTKSEQARFKKSGITSFIICGGGLLIVAILALTHPEALTYMYFYL